MGMFADIRCIKTMKRPYLELLKEAYQKTLSNEFSPRFIIKGEQRAYDSFKTMLNQVMVSRAKLHYKKTQDLSKRQQLNVKDEDFKLAAKAAIEQIFTDELDDQLFNQRNNNRHTLLNECLEQAKQLTVDKAMAAAGLRNKQSEQQNSANSEQTLKEKNNTEKKSNYGWDTSYRKLILFALIKMPTIFLTRLLSVWLKRLILSGISPDRKQRLPIPQLLLLSLIYIIFDIIILTIMETIFDPINSMVRPIYLFSTADKMLELFIVVGVVGFVLLSLLTPYGWPLLAAGFNGVSAAIVSHFAWDLLVGQIIFGTTALSLLIVSSAKLIKSSGHYWQDAFTSEGVKSDIQILLEDEEQQIQGYRRMLLNFVDLAKGNTALSFSTLQDQIVPRLKKLEMSSALSASRYNHPPSIPALLPKERTFYTEFFIAIGSIPRGPRPDNLNHDLDKPMYTFSKSGGSNEGSWRKRHNPLHDLKNNGSSQESGSDPGDQSKQGNGKGKTHISVNVTNIESAQGDDSPRGVPSPGRDARSKKPVVTEDELITSDTDSDDNQMVYGN